MITDTQPNTEQSKVAPEKTPMLTKLLFGVGQSVEVAKIWIFETLVLFYYSQVIGLSPSLAGLALLVAMTVDAITDPLIGDLSDNHRSERWGPRHGFMLAALLPAAVFVFMLFSADSAWSQTTIFVWLVAACVGLRVSLTFFAIPYSAQMADLSHDRNERTQFTVFRMLSGAGMRYALIVMAFEVFFAPTAAFANGQEDPQAYDKLAILAALLIIVFGAVSALGTLSAVKAKHRQDQQSGSKPSSSLNPVFRMLTFWFDVVLTKDNLRALIVYSALIAVMTGIHGGLILYFGTYYWELTPSEIGIWSQLMIPGMVVALLLGPILIKRIEPKSVLMIAVTVYVISLGFPFLPVEAGMMDRTADASRLILYVSKAINGFAFGALILCIPVMASEVADERRASSGRFVPALIFGAIFFTTKAGGGLGGLIAGLGLTVIGFPSLAEIRETGVGVTDHHLTSLALLYVTTIGAILGLMLWNVGRGYQLTRSEHFEALQSSGVSPKPDAQ